MPLSMNRNDVAVPDDCFAVFPIRRDGLEVTWALQPETLREKIEKGYIRFGKWKKGDTERSFAHLQKGTIERIESGEIKILGYGEEGTVILGSTAKPKRPSTIWNMQTHDAGVNGKNLLTSILPNCSFIYPKSVYAERDTIRFVVGDKPRALIVDFFAGSGTTLHAVNVLNAEDGGHRRCILVTNNEVSDEEAKAMTKRGLKSGDEEWERYGIARYVTWPRTVCSIEGHDVNGNPLRGNYLGSDRPMADGFKANAAFFTLGFLDKNAVALGRQFKEMLPTLWMKAGAIGRCPAIGEETPAMLVLPENHFAVLVDETQYMAFVEALDAHPEIETVFIVTDSESGYRDMIAPLHGKQTYQLYRDYLDNFRINSVRR